MDYSFILNILDAVLIVGIAIPSAYMATRIRQARLRTLTVLLSGFLVFHGLYHAAAALGTLQWVALLGQLSDLFFEPLGWLILLVFTLYLARSVG